MPEWSHLSGLHRARRRQVMQGRAPWTAEATTRIRRFKGAKRHILVDMLGLLLNVVVHPADVLLERHHARLHGDTMSLARLWRDQGKSRSKRANCSLRSMAGSLKGSIRAI